MQLPNFKKGIVCLCVHKGTAWTLLVISETMYTLNQQSQFWNRLVRTNTAATWPVRTQAASLNNLWINQCVLSYLGKQKGRSHSRTQCWGRYISGPKRGKATRQTKLHNTEFRYIYSLPNIRLMKSRKIRWVRQCGRKREKDKHTRSCEKMWREGATCKT